MIRRWWNRGSTTDHRVFVVMVGALLAMLAIQIDNGFIGWVLGGIAMLITVIAFGWRAE